ncbi:RNA polymerase sigma factor [Aliiroseovarius sp.]|uniref:RNA polymerase sigma factor n=1 Tax=Aliiroseovarius sp. TaxID=1872442 RepID=UPI003BA91C02
MKMDVNMDREMDREELCTLMPELMRLARILAPNRTAAEDLAQEALLKVWARLADGADIDALKPYLNTVIRRLAREAPGLETQAEDWDLPDELGSGAGYLRLCWRDVDEALDRLPPPQGDLLRGVAAGRSYARLAEDCGVPPGTVMSRIARARAGLRRELDLSEGAACAELLG